MKESAKGRFFENVHMKLTSLGEQMYGFINTRSQILKIPNKQKGEPMQSKNLTKKIGAKQSSFR